MVSHTLVSFSLSVEKNVFLLVTINILLILQVRDNLFFMRENALDFFGPKMAPRYARDHFKGPKKSRAPQKPREKAPLSVFFVVGPFRILEMAP